MEMTKPLAQPADEGMSKEKADYEKCKRIADAPNILAVLDEELRGCGLVGERANANLIFLSSYTRHFDKPVSLVIQGSSGAGKSNLLNTALRFVDPRSYVALGGTSEKALIFTNRDLRHKHLVIQEMASLGGEDGMRYLRQILSEGSITYEMTVIDREVPGTEIMQTDGPMGLMMTTTETNLNHEDQTRLLPITLDESPEQIKAVLLAKAVAVAGGVTARAEFEEWHVFDQFISESVPKIIIPFAENMVCGIGAHSHRMKRDVDQLFSLIQAHALIHQMHRERDGNGALLCDYEDYAVVRELMEPVVSRGLEQTVPTDIREVLAAVKAISEKNSRKVVSQNEIVEFFGSDRHSASIDKSNVSRRVAKALKTPYLLNFCKDKGKSDQLVLAHPLPEDNQILPTVEDVKAPIIEMQA